MSLHDDSSTRKNWNPARTEAAKLKSLRLGFFDAPLTRPIRYFEHLVLDNIRFGKGRNFERMQGLDYFDNFCLI